jgi:hypothetical protein
VLLLLVGGVSADRLPRRHILIASDVLSAAFQAALAVLILSGAIRFWELLAIEAASGVAGRFSVPPTRDSFPRSFPTLGVGRLIGFVLIAAALLPRETRTLQSRPQAGAVTDPARTSVSLVREAAEA